MPTGYTTLLGFAQPADGELSGTWGDVFNASVTQLLEDALAGSATQSVTSADWTLTTTGSGATNQARMGLIVPTGTPGVSRNVIAPSQSKWYLVQNKSDTGIIFKGAATTGVSIAAAESTIVFWNGTDFVKMSFLTGVATVGATAPITSSGGTNPTIAISVDPQFTSIGVGTAASGSAGDVRATGNVSGYYSSDRKFKKNIRDIPDALSIVIAIGCKLFDWKAKYIKTHGGEDGYFVREEDFGVIAQDVQKVFPQAVRTREDGSLAVDYQKLGVLSFGALAQLAARVEVLEAKA